MRYSTSQLLIFTAIIAIWLCLSGVVISWCPDDIHGAKYVLGPFMAAAGMFLSILLLAGAWCAAVEIDKWLYGTQPEEE